MAIFLDTRGNRVSEFHEYAGDVDPPAAEVAGPVTLVGRAAPGRMPRTVPG